MEEKSKPSYKFDFNAEVARARRDYPEETKNILFVDLNAPDAKGKIKTEFYKAFMPELRGDADYKKKVDNMIDSAVEKQMHRRDCAYRVSKMSQAMILQNTGTAYRTPKGSLTGSTPDIEAFFIFAHELGHLVVKDAVSSIGNTETPCDIQKMEIKADSFSALYGLKNGILDKNDINRLSFNRMWRVLLGDEKHLTSEALDHIIISMDQADFVSLTTKSIHDIARAHGEKFAQTSKDLSSVSEAFESFSLKHPAMVIGCASGQNGSVHDSVINNEGMCSALAAHFSSARYRFGLCGKLENYAAKKAVSAVKASVI